MDHVQAVRFRPPHNHLHRLFKAGIGHGPQFEGGDGSCCGHIGGSAAVVDHQIEAVRGRVERACSGKRFSVRNVCANSAISARNGAILKLADTPLSVLVCAATPCAVTVMPAPPLCA